MDTNLTSGPGMYRMAKTELEAPALDSLDADELTGLLGQVEALRFRILSRLCPATPTPAAAQPMADGRMIDIAETARRIGMSRSWLYRNASKLAFARRISNRWRFDTRGLEKYLRDRQPC